MNKENLLALRNALDAVLGDEQTVKSPRKRQSKKQRLIEEFRQQYASGKWAQKGKKILNATN